MERMAGFRSRVSVLAVGGVLLPMTAQAAPPVSALEPGQVLRVSVAADGSEAVAPVTESPGHEINRAIDPTLSRNGRFVVWTDYAENLVPGDQNGVRDVFVRDLELGTTRIASLTDDDLPADGPSDQAVVSDNGRFVAFASAAKNLIPGKVPGTTHVYVRDMHLNTTRLVSATPAGNFANGYSMKPSISSDGRLVAFSSRAADITPGDSGANFDVFVRDLDEATTRLVSRSPEGASGDAPSDAPVISSSGRFVVYRSDARNIVRPDASVRDIFVADLETGETRNAHRSVLGVDPNGYADLASISDDGNVVAFMSNSNNLVANDTNGFADVFVHRFDTGATERISVTSQGEEGNSLSWSPTVSADGRYVSFMTWATNLVPNDVNGQSDILVRDLEAKTTRLASGTATTPAAGSSEGGLGQLLSSDGRLVIFGGTGANLVPDDNHSRDIYVRDMGPRLGVGGITYSVDGDDLAVSGWSSTQGTASWHFEDEVGDSGPLASGDVTAARVMYRATERDVAVEIDLAEVPAIRHPSRNVALPVPMTVVEFGTSHVGGRFQLRGAPYEVGAPSGPAFTLHYCTVSCRLLKPIRGGYATIGSSVFMAASLNDIGLPPHGSLPGVPVGLREGGHLFDVEVFTVMGSPGVGAVGAVLDHVDGPGSVQIPAPSTVIGVGPVSGGIDQVVAFHGTEASGPYGFTGLLDASGLEGDHRVWAKTCFAGECRTASTRVHI